jgi:cytochrome bd-type quinol oxidase subunit 2
MGPPPAGLTELENLVANVISVIVALGFIAMFVMLIMAGFKYLTSGGEPKAIQTAHHTLSWAILGILLMIVAWILLQLIQAFTDIPVTVFNIKTLCNIAGVDICKATP